MSMILQHITWKVAQVLDMCGIGDNSTERNKRNRKNARHSSSAATKPSTERQMQILNYFWSLNSDRFHNRCGFV
ncbi:MAG: hypothetical protein RM347_007440 [Nostoc sp. ChiQUE02]|uniref:hypothetical protein n=1 Tax=Nostoc sp. ChiQUE02 TaxID=3075377 RepID=UPI002AD28407|nr:hypothetical protein [Nostoc sp. ChiQUE02]